MGIKFHTLTLSKVSTFLSLYWHIIATIFVLLTVGGFISYLNKDQINPDGVSYFQIADYYAHFDIKSAINGYWAPLLSWLLVPFAWLDINPPTAYRMLTLIITITTASLLLYRLNYKKDPSQTKKLTQFLFISTTCILLVRWGSSVITPDMLSGIILCLVLLCAYFCLKNTNSTKLAVALGVSLSLLYFSRSIGLYLSIAILVVLILHAITDKKRVFRHITIAASIFAVLSLTWILLISFKYGTLTISTSSKYNTALYGPEKPLHPQLKTGYLDTPYNNSVWGWDDPSYFSLPEWKITEHKRYFLYNFINTLSKSVSLFIFSTPLLVIALFLIGKTKMGRVEKTIILSLIVTVVLTILAYSKILFVEERYMWIIIMPVLVVACIYAARYYSDFALNCILTLLLSTTILGTYSSYQSTYQQRYTDYSIESVSKALKGKLPSNATVAGDFDYVYKFCFYSDTRCVGNYKLTGVFDQDLNYLHEMRSNQISYYVDFTGNSIPYLNQIYSIKSSAKSCFDPNLGKNISCNQTKATIYQLN